MQICPKGLAKRGVGRGFTDTQKEWRMNGNIFGGFCIRKIRGKYGKEREKRIIIKKMNVTSCTYIKIFEKRPFVCNGASQCE